MLEKQDNVLHVVSVDPDDFSGGLEVPVAFILTTFHFDHFSF